MKEGEFEFILKQGEGQFIKFKEKIDNSFVKEITAFANSTGGRIFLGVSDEGIVKGINVTNRLKSQIIDAAKNCDPSVFVEIESFMNILIINVPEGENKPYSCSLGFFLRIGPNSQKLKRDDILKFAVTEGKISFDEQINKDFNYPADFSKEKLKEYILEAKISSNLDEKQILINLGVAKEIKGKFYFNNAGVLFFAKTPSDFFIQSKIICAEYKTNEKVDIIDKKIFDDGVLRNISDAINFLKKKIKVKFIIISAKRKEVFQFPIEAFREIIVNAIMHRDYFDRSSDVLVESYRNKIVVYNPGGLVSWLRPEEFGSVSKCRNFLIASLLSRTAYAEKMGTGINRIILAMKNSGLPLPIFKHYEHSFYVELRDNEPVNEPVKRRGKILEYLVKKGGAGRKELEREFNVNVSTLKRDLTLLIKEKKVIRVGSDKKGYYKVARR